MKLSEFKDPAPLFERPSQEPSVSAEAPEGPEVTEASPEEYTTATTPSGIEVYYSWAPRRHYKLRKIVPPQRDGAAGFYTDWQEVPSVTTVLGVLDKSGPLVWWAQQVGVEGVLALLKSGAVEWNSGELWTDFPNIRQVEVQDVVDLLVREKLSVNHVKDSAADRGVNVHGALEAWCDGKPIPGPDHWTEAEQPYILGLANFVLALDGKVGNVEAELMVGSLEHQYAGRFDLVLTLSKPVEVVTRCYPKKPPKVETIPADRYLLDLKTSKRVYDTHFLQLEAYEAAAVECGHAATDHRGVVHVTADGRYELVLNTKWCFEDFLAVRGVYTVLHERDKLENEREVLRALREELGAREVKA